MNQKHSKEYKSIGQTIKKYRKLRGLTQEQLADMVCISISYLTKIEAPNCDQPFSRKRTISSTLTNICRSHG